MTFFHGSKDPLLVGETLEARINQGWFPRPIELAMEEGRPQGVPSRLSSWFLVDERKLISTAGGGTQYVYRVKPIGVYSKHHQGWMGEVYGVMIPFIRHRAPQEEKEEAATRLVYLAEWIHNYWEGVPYRHHPNQAKTAWEFLAPVILIEEQVWPVMEE